MNIVELIRLETSDSGTFGVLKVDKRIFCLTLEPPEKQNWVNTSCIPCGQYVCSRHVSPAHGECYSVDDVPGRTHILFHAGNNVHQTSGCILVGERVGSLRGQRSVLNSRLTLNRLLELDDNFLLTISRDY